MKKCLVVLQGPELTGASRSLLDWTSVVNNEYHFIFVVPSKKGGVVEELKKRKSNYISLKYYLPVIKNIEGTVKEKLKNLLRRILYNSVNRFSLIKLNKVLKKKKHSIDIVHSNSFTVDFGAKFADKYNIKHVWHIREYMKEDYNTIHMNSNKIKKLAEHSSAIFISNALRNHFCERYKFLNTSVIYNQVKYNDKYSKERILFEDKKIRVLIAGALVQSKGQLIAIKAIELLVRKGYNIFLFIAGDGPERQSLENYCKINNLDNIEFIGFQNNLIDFRKNIDIALMCSSNEAFGRVTIEAMYYENLIIGANSGGTSELIEDGINGFLYELNNTIDLSEKIEFAINNKDIAEKIINNAKKNAIIKYSRPIFSQIIEIYEMKQFKNIFFVNGTLWQEYSLKDLENDESVIVRKKSDYNPFLFKLYRLFVKIKCPLEKLFFKMLLKENINLPILYNIYLFDRNKLGLDFKFLRFLKNSSNVKLIYIFTDNYCNSDCKNFSSIDKIKEVYDLVYTYNFYDVDRYDLKYFPIMYSRLDKIFKQKEKTNFNCLYVGQSKKRIDDILFSYRLLKKYIGKPRYVIINYSNEEKLEGVSTSMISYTQVIDMILESKAIVDIAQKESNGFNLKVCEAVIFDKILFTDNSKIKELSFYDPTKMVLISEISQKIDILLENKVEYTDEQKRYFSPNRFIEEVYRELKYE